jgi:hypothetical protein
MRSSRLLVSLVNKWPKQAGRFVRLVIQSLAQGPVTPQGEFYASYPVLPPFANELDKIGVGGVRTSMLKGL